LRIPIAGSLSSFKRNEGFVVLMLALPGQELVIAAAILFGKGAAGCGTMLVDGAVSLRRVKKLTSAFEDVVFAVSQHTMAVFLDELGEFALGLFITQLESLCQSRYVALRDQYPIICATVSRTFRTVVAEVRYYGIAVGGWCIENR
jgi:hypothetical protein